MAESFLGGRPVAQAMIKAGMDQSGGRSFGEAFAFEALTQLICLGSEDAVEGIGAFLQKRAPVFKGR